MANPKRFVSALVAVFMAGITLQCLGVYDVFAALSPGMSGTPVTLEGNTTGITITMNDTMFSTTGGGMLPGETASSSVTVRNTSGQAFNLWVRVEDKSTNPELLQALDIKVSQDGNLLASFPVKGSPADTLPHGVSLGSITAAGNTTLDVEVYLPGGTASQPDYQNNLQGNSARLEWIFTAEFTDTPPIPPPSDGPDDPPDDPPDIPGTPPDTTTQETEPITDVASSTTELPAEETPLGAPVVPEGDETVELDEETPLGPEKEMPKTGETALTFFAAAGALLILMGLLILLQDRKRKNQ